VPIMGFTAPRLPADIEAHMLAIPTGVPPGDALPYSRLLRC
jgi:hypothetical protein